MDHHLSKIILENIQSIEEYTEIPIEPITILVGPNSAGKSAILDVLQSVIPTCLGNTNRNWIPDGNEENRKQILLKSFRNNSINPEVKIGIEYTYTSKGFDPQLCNIEEISWHHHPMAPFYLNSDSNEAFGRHWDKERKRWFGKIFHPIDDDGKVSDLPSLEPKDKNKVQSTKILHMFTFTNTSSPMSDNLDSYTLTLDDKVVLEFKTNVIQLKDGEPGAEYELFHTFDIYFENQKWFGWRADPPKSTMVEVTSEAEGLRSRFRRSFGSNWSPDNITLNFPRIVNASVAAQSFWEIWHNIILLTGYDAAQDALKISPEQKNLTPASRSIPTPEECIFLGSNVWHPNREKSLSDEVSFDPNELMWDKQIKFQRNAILQNLADSLAADKYQALLSKYPKRQKRFYCDCSSKESRSYWIECVSHDSEKEMEIRYCPNCGKKVNTVIVDYTINNRADSELAKNVNDYLIGDLLIDKGYQFDIKTAWLTDDDNFFNPKKWPILDKDAKTYQDSIIQGEIPDNYNQSPPVPTEEYRQIRPLIRLLIKDAQGNSFNFEDIGSGIAYMLPVIITGCDKTNTIKFIQQPELHIHPGLQSNLANIFTNTFENPIILEAQTSSVGVPWSETEFYDIEYSEVIKTSQFIIETHSEHLILRILKLIKDSKKRKSTRPIKPENVSLLYFHPDPIKNCTQIKRIRISEDGGFVDRWPNGFFTERYKDIFDEEN